MDVFRGQPLKVILSVDPIKFPLTGIGRYAYELARGLQQASLDDLQFLRGTRLQTMLPRPVTARPMNKKSAWKVFAQKSRLAVSLYSVLNPLLKGRALRGMEDYLFHSPNYYLPPFAGRSVVTIHDLSTFLWPETHPPERVRYMQEQISLALKRASALITDSEYTRLEVAKFFSWPLERIHAVPLASSDEFRPREYQDILERLRLFNLAPGEYTLFAGTVEPRKNISSLLDAYSRLPESIRTRWPLVITGYRGWQSDDLHRRLDKAQREGWLKYLGYVSNETLPILMSGARLFAYPSLYEGFGLPVLEAMASGVPVVCSNAASLPEVAGDAAAFHAPEDAETLQALIRTGLEDDVWQTKAIQAGLQQAAKFSWQRCTRETISVYETI